jgi:hypothetical protein
VNGLIRIKLNKMPIEVVNERLTFEDRVLWAVLAFLPDFFLLLVAVSPAMKEMLVTLKYCYRRRTIVEAARLLLVVSIIESVSSCVREVVDG